MQTCAPHTVKNDTVSLYCPLYAQQHKRYESIHFAEHYTTLQRTWNTWFYEVSHTHKLEPQRCTPNYIEL
jgi:hypothetical protein